jgi:hypothetical protein
LVATGTQRLFTTVDRDRNIGFFGGRVASDKKTGKKKKKERSNLVSLVGDRFDRMDRPLLVDLESELVVDGYNLGTFVGRIRKNK